MERNLTETPDDELVAERERLDWHVKKLNGEIAAINSEIFRRITSGQSPQSNFERETA